ncbi:hypothetical protein [Vulgatibacter incomptus]|uniref:Uncharacterized protein n=1 Tax=Vulgatibacter incomptus TaxID=1391653 RepID=A0A0K1PDN8_9BACT|nr:hypothetical protein [Vulgatibacter incomptus]AKU91214.1 hypothetical protein AKJ08_1601 [Vulgatibacter incomptus]
MDPIRFRTLLKGIGYEILEREDTWAECLILGHGEAWLGSGKTSEAAFEAAVAKCLPSHLSQHLLRLALADEIAAPADAPSLPRPQTQSTELAPREIPSAPPVEPVAWLVTTADPPAPEAQLLVAPFGDAVAPAPGPTVGLSLVVAEEHEAPAASSLAAELRHPNHDLLPPTPERRDRVIALPASRESVADGLLELSRISADIETRRRGVALMSPRRQRLVILEWLASARSVQERMPFNLEIEEAVPALVKTLRWLSEAWWPGMIAAFQLSARPRDAARDLRLAPGAAPTTWAETARRAAEALRRCREEDAATGFDEHGWADAAQLAPPPPDPERLLRETIAAVERIGGSLGKRPESGQERPDKALLLAWSQDVRWLRNAVADPEGWAALAGRLRFWCQYSLDPGDAVEVLDPAYRPPRSWSTVHERAGAASRDAEALARVLRTIPGPLAPNQAWIGWLEEALPLTSTHQAAIVAATFEQRERILAIREDDLREPSKQLRRRLAKFHQAFVRAAEPSTVPPPEEEETLEASAAEPHALPDERILACTRGKRALFVGNRADELLRERLVETFRFEDLDWTESSPRRVEAAVEAIGSGSYDLVLAATGFLAHKEDGRLSQACRGAGVIYVRVNKGRPKAVELAIDRELTERAG